MQFELPEKEVKTPELEEFRAVYRRRGSDLIFGATVSGKLQVSRYNHRYKAFKYYLHDNAQEFFSKLDEMKQYLDREGYKPQTVGPIDPPGPPAIAAS